MYPQNIMNTNNIRSHESYYTLKIYYNISDTPILIFDLHPHCRETGDTVTALAKFMVCWPQVFTLID